MNEEIKDEIEGAVPEPVEPSNLDSIVTDLTEQFNLGDVDQGQEEAATDNTSEPVSTETQQTEQSDDNKYEGYNKVEGHALTREEHKRYIEDKVKSGEKILLKILLHITELT